MSDSICIENMMVIALLFSILLHKKKNLFDMSIEDSTHPPSICLHTALPLYHHHHKQKNIMIDNMKKDMICYAAQE